MRQPSRALGNVMCSSPNLTRIMAILLFQALQSPWLSTLAKFSAIPVNHIHSVQQRTLFKRRKSLVSDLRCRPLALTYKRDFFQAYLAFACPWRSYLEAYYEDNGRRGKEKKKGGGTFYLFSNLFFFLHFWKRLGSCLELCRVGWVDLSLYPKVKSAHFDSENPWKFQFLSST